MTNNKQWNWNYSSETTIPPKSGASWQIHQRMKEKKNGWIYSCANISCIKQHYSIEFGKYLQVRATEHWPGLGEAFL